MLIEWLTNKIDNFSCYLGRAIKNDFRLIEIDYKKVIKIIRSCKCKEHLDVANRVITCFYMKHNNNFLLKKLEKRFEIKKKILLKA